MLKGSYVPYVIWPVWKLSGLKKKEKLGVCLLAKSLCMCIG